VILDYGRRPPKRRRKLGGLRQTIDPDVKWAVIALLAWASLLLAAVAAMHVSSSGVLDKWQIRQLQ
jgi:hypothetical protein